MLFPVPIVADIDDDADDEEEEEDGTKPAGGWGSKSGHKHE